jgi:hypothetical protein
MEVNMVAKLDFTVNEQWRQYIFHTDNSFNVVRIENPKRIVVTDSGGHVIEDCAGNGHYIPAGWMHIEWRPDTGHDVIQYPSTDGCTASA